MNDVKTCLFRVSYVDDDGRTVVKEVEARNEFEAAQLAGGFNKPHLCVVNLDL